MRKRGGDSEEERGGIVRKRGGDSEEERGR